MEGGALLVTRDLQGGIHAFVNLCRHRGVRLVHEKHGVTKSFTCLLHGWTYSADGQMGGAPLAKLAQNNPMLATIRENAVLIPLPFAIRHGFVWVAPRPRDELDLAAVDQALEGRAIDAFVVRERDEQPDVELRAVIREHAGSEDRVYVVSDDTVLVIHPETVSVFTRVQRAPAPEFFENEGVRAVERLVLGP